MNPQVSFLNDRVVSLLTYKALDKVNYEQDNLDRLATDSNTTKGGAARNKSSKRKNAASLLDITSRVIVQEDDSLSEVIHVIPCHVVQNLLKAAIHCRKYKSVAVLVSEWPLETLHMQSIFPKDKKDLFLEATDLGQSFMKGLLRREKTQPHVKLKCLNFHGFVLGENFIRNLISSLPIMSIPRELRNLSNIVNQLKEFLDAVLDTEDFNEIMEDIIDTQITYLEPAFHESAIYDLLESLKDDYVYIPEGEQLVIKLDKLTFDDSYESKVTDYIQTRALGNMTSFRLEVNNLHIYPDSDEDNDSCPPYYALLGQDPQTLHGVSVNMNDMEDQCENILALLSPFTTLRALDIGNCCFSITGRTRVKTASRNRIIRRFRTLHELRRLDLSGSDLAGYLSDLLEALPRQLEYLNLSSCLMQTEDLRYLASSKHTSTMKELHLSSLLKPDGINSVDQIFDCIRSFTSTLYVLEVQNIEIKETCIKDFCEIISKCKCLKLLDATYNYLREDTLFQLVEATALCPTAQCLGAHAISFIPNLNNADDISNHQLAFMKRCKDALMRLNKEDFALFVSCVNIFPLDDID